MFRLKDNQLHIILGIICAASFIIGCIFVLSGDKHSFLKGEFPELQNMSEGWVITYETHDARKWKQYNPDDKENDYGTITEILGLPVDIETPKGKEVILSRKLPETIEDKIYVVFKTKNQHVTVSINEDIFLDNDYKEDSFSYHIIEIPKDYQNMVITLRARNDDNGIVSMGKIRYGDYTQLMFDSFRESRSYVFIGILLILISGISLVACIMMTGTFISKKLIRYTCLQGIAVGILFLLGSRLLRVMINREFICYYMQCCFVIIASILHLLVIRCVIRKKKILSIVDIGVLLYSVVFVSVIVLQWFGLITFDTAYIVELIAFAVGVIAYTLLMGTAAYDYGQKNGKPVFVANLVLIVCTALELILDVASKGNEKVRIPFVVGWGIYYVILWIFGMKLAGKAEIRRDALSNDVTELKQRIIEQFNPNLLFASFKTLQQLIKNNSAQSTKMIYYISAYVMGNIKAMTGGGDIIDFEEELNHIIAYLQLQKTRSGKLDFAIECKVKDFRLPRNSIEPMVENAVAYGVAAKEGKGNVVIRSYEREEGYAIQIIDDGVGFDTNKLKKHSETSLRNLFELLEDKCDALTEVISKEGKGTVITIIIPMLENELMDEPDYEE